MRRIAFAWDRTDLLWSLSLHDRLAAGIIPGMYAGRPRTPATRREL